MIERASDAPPYKRTAERQKELQFDLATWTLSMRLRDSRTARMRARFSGLGETSGRRQTGWRRPISASADFTGMGLDSTKLMSIKARYWKWRRRASAKSPESADCTRRVISAGISLEATEIKPRPPREMRGSVKESSPERTRKSLETRLRMAPIWEMLPEASLMPTMFLIWERRRTVEGSILTPVRP